MAAIAPKSRTQATALAAVSLRRPRGCRSVRGNHAILPTPHPNPLPIRWGEGNSTCSLEFTLPSEEREISIKGHSISRIAPMNPDEFQTTEQLLPLVYAELRRLAAHKMANENPGQTLQPTALVHEAWLKLGENRQW